MSNYTHNVTRNTDPRKLPDLWSPFRIDNYGDGENVFLTPLDVTSQDTPYIGMCYTENGTHVTEVDQLGWSAVSGLTSRSGDIQEPAEYINAMTLLGLETDIYQVVFVDMLYCDECHECDDSCDDGCEYDEYDCEHDMTVGWALMKVDY